jgi:flagellar basal body-associated protein FliL
MALEDIEEQLEELEETEEGEKTEESPGGPEKSSRQGGGVLRALKKVSLFLVAVCVVAVLAYFLLRPGGGKGVDTFGAATTHEFGDQTLNLRDGKTALRLNVVVEVNDARCLTEVVSHESLLRDKVIEILSRKTRDEVDSVVKRNKLKRELLDDFNVELDMEDGRLTHIYFREFFYYDLTGASGN